jgi:FtsH-binding integral membrane protein
MSDPIELIVESADKTPEQDYTLLPDETEEPIKLSEKEKVLLDSPPISECPLKQQHAVYRKILFTLFLMLAFMFGAQYVTLVYLNLKSIIISFPWLAFIVLGLLILVFIVWWTTIFDQFSIPLQIAGLILVVMILTTCICILGSFLDTETFWVSTLITCVLIFIYFLWCWQSYIRLSKMCSLIFVLSVLCVIGILVVWYPQI